MEYRRRRRCSRRRRYANSSGSAISVFIILILTGALIYMLCATSIGTWLAERVFAPMFKGGAHAADPTMLPGIYTAPPSPPDSSTLEPKSIDATAHGLDMYLLQMGVFTSEENAKSLVDSLISMGAAGYALNDGDVVRVIASGYNSEESASNVCARLVGQGYECTVYNLKADAVQMRITASDSRIDHIRGALQLTYSLIEQLNNEVISFDADERSADYALAVAAEILSNINNAALSIDNLTSDSEMIKALHDYLTEVSSELERFISDCGTERVEASGKFKNLQIFCIDRYYHFLSSLKALE